MQYDNNEELVGYCKQAESLRGTCPRDPTIQILKCQLDFMKRVTTKMENTGRVCSDKKYAHKMCDVNLFLRTARKHLTLPPLGFLDVDDTGWGVNVTRTL